VRRGCSGLSDRKLECDSNAWQTDAENSAHARPLKTKTGSGYDFSIVRSEVPNMGRIREYWSHPTDFRELTVLKVGGLNSKIAAILYLMPYRRHEVDTTLPVTVTSPTWRFSWETENHHFPTSITRWVLTSAVQSWWVAWIKPEGLEGRLHEVRGGDQCLLGDSITEVK